VWFKEKMESKSIRSYHSLILLSSILFFLSACATPAWFPIKKGPPHKAKMKELLDKEVILIDRHEYVKVLNPRAHEGGDQPKYLYIPVEEYLSKKEAYVSSALRIEEGKRILSHAPSLSSPSPAVGKEVSSSSVSVFPVAQLKKKVVVAHFDDRTTSADETFGDWLSEKLIKEMIQRAPQTLFIDYQMVKEFLEKSELTPLELELPKASRVLSEVFGIQAIVLGEITGPYVFTTKGTKDQEGTSTAIIKIEMKIIDTLSGKILKTISAQNPIFPTKEKGTFSDEKAKEKAFDLTINDLSRSLSRELDRLDWFCRVAKVEGEEVYINAGKLSGLRVGDVMEVIRFGSLGEKREITGKIQISALFGMDASIGKLIQGEKPNEEDILKLAGRKGS